MRHFYCLDEVALGNHFEPVGDIVMHRTLPFTVWIAAFDATGGLIGSVPLIEIGVYFVEFPDPFRCRFFLGIGALHLQKLEYVGHEPVCSG